MKIVPQRAAAFLRDPGPMRVVLLHGDDEGLIRQRADGLTLLVAGAADDPFRVAWLEEDTHDRLLEEATAIAMLGGRRVIRVRDVGDALLDDVTAAIEGPGDSLVLLEAPGVGRRSKLLTAVEAAGNAACLACYRVTGDDLRGSIAGQLQGAGVRAEPDALDWLRDHLGGDAAATTGEVEKLVLYAGAERRLDLDAVRESVGDQGATSLDDAAFATTVGDVGGADRSLERALAEGQSAVAVIRVLLLQLMRLHAARGRMDGGLSAEAAVDGMRPPVFWTRKKLLTRALGSWTTARVAAALGEVRRAELACKQTGAPDELIVRRLVMALARGAAPRRR